LVSDGFFYVPAYFTSEAVKEFKQKYGNILITDLAEKVVVLNDWRLELRRVNSNEVWTSYADLEPRLVVTSFKPQIQEKLNPHRFP
jgi:hypothetical protein